MSAVPPLKRSNNAILGESVKSEFDFRVLQSNDGSNLGMLWVMFERGLYTGFYSKWRRSRILTKVLINWNPRLLMGKKRNENSFEGQLTK